MDIDYSLKEDFRQCMEYLNVFNEPVPERSPRRPRPDKQIVPKYHADEENFSENSSDEYVLAGDNSAQSSLFSNTPRTTHTEQYCPDLEQYLEEVSASDEIGVVDGVVTIVRNHDRWDPKKVSLISY